MTPRSHHLIVTLSLLALLWAACTSSYQKQLDAGDALMSQGAYRDALQAYRAAAREEPDAPEARERAAQAQRALLAEYTAQLRELLARGEHPAAVQLAADAYASAPEDPATSAITREVSLAMQQRSARALEAGDFASALDALTLTYQHLPTERVGLEAPIQDLKQRWAEALVGSAQQAQSAGYEGDALLLYAKAATLVMDPDYVRQRDALRASLLGQHPYRVLLRGRGTRDVRVVQEGIDGLDWAQNVKLVAHERTAQLVLAYEVSAARFREERTSSTRTVRYKSGTRQVPNPAYQRDQEEVLRQQRELVRRQEEVAKRERELANYQQQVAREGDTPGTSTMAEQGVSRTQSSLSRERDNAIDQQRRVIRAQEQAARTPQLIEEDVYSDLPYEVTRYDRLGELPLVLEARVVGAQGDDAAQHLRITTSASDETHAAYPFAGVSGDPLNLPSEAQLRRELLAGAADRVVAAVLAELTTYRRALVTQAMTLADERARIHQLVIVILLDPTQVDADVLEEIVATRGIPDVVRVLAPPAPR